MNCNKDCPEIQKALKVLSAAKDFHGKAGNSSLAKQGCMKEADLETLKVQGYMSLWYSSEYLAFFQIYHAY